MFFRIVISLWTERMESLSRRRNSSLRILMAAKLLFVMLLPRYTLEVFPSPKDLMISYCPLNIGWSCLPVLGWWFACYCMEKCRLKDLDYRLENFFGYKAFLWVSFGCLNVRRLKLYNKPRKSDTYIIRNNYGQYRPLRQKNKLFFLIDIRLTQIKPPK